MKIILKTLPFLTLILLAVFSSCHKDDGNDKQSEVEVNATFTIDGSTHKFSFKNNLDCGATVKTISKETVLTAISICDEGNKNTSGNCQGKYVGLAIYGNKPGVYPGIDNDNDGIPEIGVAFYDSGEILYTSPVNDKNSSITIYQFGDKYITGHFTGELIDVVATKQVSNKTIIVSATGEFKAYLNKIIPE